MVHPALARATSTNFETGDRMGVFLTEKDVPLEVSGNYVNNELLAYSGSKWESARKIYWNDGTYDVFGYYPYVAPLTVWMICRLKLRWIRQRRGKGIRWEVTRLVIFCGQARKSDRGGWSGEVNVCSPDE